MSTQTLTETNSIPRINDTAPNFTAETTQGTIDFHQWIGDGWAILFSHPKDFTPVCTTELGYMARLEPEFAKRNYENHRPQRRPGEQSRQMGRGHRGDSGRESKLPDDWRSTNSRSPSSTTCCRPTSGNTSEGRTAADNATVRTVFVVGPDKKIKLHAQLSHEHGPQLRRSAARPGFDAAHGEAQGGDAGELEAGRRRDHPARR